jgi:hypothetical protein
VAWNGQYSLKAITELNTLKQLFRDSLELSFTSRCDVKDNSYRRVIDNSITPSEWIDTILTLKTHNVVFNRWVYNNYQIKDTKYGEIGSCTMNLEYDKFLWIYVSLENLELLVEKYNLPKWII